jgi:hypothetical protein
VRVAATVSFSTEVALFADESAGVDRYRDPSGPRPWWATSSGEDFGVDEVEALVQVAAELVEVGRHDRVALLCAPLRPRLHRRAAIP